MLISRMREPPARTSFVRGDHIHFELHFEKIINLIFVVLSPVRFVVGNIIDLSTS